MIMLSQLYQDPSRRGRAQKSNVSAHQPFPGDFVTQVDAKGVKGLQLLLDSFHLKADVVKSFTFFFDVERYTAVRPDSLKKLQVGVTNRYEASTNTDVFSDDNLARFQPKDTLIKVDAGVEICYCNPDVMH